MGNVIKIKCDKCDIDNSIKIGSGMFFDPLLVGKFPAFCSKCGKYVSVEVRKTEENGDINSVSCSICGEAVHIKHVETDSKCDKCGGNLNVEEIGLWD